MSKSPDSISSGSDSEASPVDPPKQAAPAVGTIPSDHTRGRSSRPKGSRNGSSTALPTSKSYQDNSEFPHGDARDMSPRRGSEETEVMEEAARAAVREQARQLQLSLLEIAESIELVKADHDKLEKQNLALQDYIGGLTRSMSKGQMPKGARSSK